jgi:hypothetical protein
MQMSTVQQRGRVTFPEFTGERVYMREFTKAAGLPPNLARWQPTVDAMLDGVDAPGSIFLMVDQSPVRAGAAQRRPGLHVDGYWNAADARHGGGHGGHKIDGSATEALLLASSVFGGCGYVGRFDGNPGDGGDCEHIGRDGLLRVDMVPGRVWAGHALRMLHESVPVRRDALRTLVRLNVAGWAPQ